MNIGSYRMTLGISGKLFILFSLFILIFYGTVFDLFIKVQDMSKTSDRIVRINNQVAVLSENLRDRLLDMEANHKKFRLLKKEVYFGYFETARKAYNRDLDQIIDLNSDPHPASDLWTHIRQTYTEYTAFRSMDTAAGKLLHWDDKNMIDQWMAAIVTAGKNNDIQTQEALIRINDQSRKIVRNGVIGFGISIIAGVVGILFISRSILTPLNKLKAGLTQVSNDNYLHKIEIASKDEFRELADTFNDMSRQLRADDDIRSDFIATLSHEIRTPLSSIQESVNMITEELLGPVNHKQKKFLKLANSEISRITELLNHLLDISMLESGSDTFDHRPLNPNRLVNEAIRLVEPAASAKQTILRSNPLPDAPHVIGEKKEVMQVLMNIIGNAVKFSDKSSRVDIRLSKKTGDAFLHFYISDNGPGIPADKHTLIFKKYYRTKEVRNHMSGVGLGLNISRRIIRAHGGKIGVTNNKKKGCTFWFTLPVQNKKIELKGN